MSRIIGIFYIISAKYLQVSENKRIFATDFLTK